MFLATCIYRKKQVKMENVKISCSLKNAIIKRWFILSTLQEEKH